MVTIRSRGRLPHWEEIPATYFVTFRLAESLPRNILEQFEFERRDIVATAQAMHRELSPGERSRLRELFNEKIEAYLDAGSGNRYLAEPSVALLVQQTLHHFNSIRYRIFAWCVMPNHVHVVFQPMEGYKLSAILHAWKSYSAKRANSILGRSGAFWQREYYDHLVRNENEFRRIVRYVLGNPKKAKLANWPWVGVGR